MSVLSLSARRAWIEISQSPVKSVQCFPVALRKESVDRNDNGAAVAVSDLVALRKESVDRNSPVSASTNHAACRSPQGERG